MAHRETRRHREAFEVWWENDRSAVAVQNQFRLGERIVYYWIQRFGWHERADRRDAAAKAKADRAAVARRAEMIERHRRAGMLMVTRGMERLGKAPLEHAKDAITGIKSGVEIERTAEGLPAWALEILNADPDTLLARRQALLVALDAAGANPDRREPHSPGDTAAGEDDPGCLGSEEPAAV